jgi:hypothetical protein
MIEALKTDARAYRKATGELPDGVIAIEERSL